MVKEKEHRFYVIARKTAAVILTILVAGASAYMIYCANKIPAVAQNARPTITISADPNVISEGRTLKIKISGTLPDELADHDTETTLNLVIQAGTATEETDYKAALPESFSLIWLSKQSASEDRDNSYFSLQALTDDIFESGETLLVTSIVTPLDGFLVSPATITIRNTAATVVLPRETTPTTSSSTTTTTAEPSQPTHGTPPTTEQPSEQPEPTTSVAPPISSTTSSTTTTISTVSPSSSTTSSTSTTVTSTTLQQTDPAITSPPSAPEEPPSETSLVPPSTSSTSTSSPPSEIPIYPQDTDETPEKENDNEDNEEETPTSTPTKKERTPPDTQPPASADTEETDNGNKEQTDTSTQTTIAATEPTRKEDTEEIETQTGRKSPPPEKQTG